MVVEMTDKEKMEFVFHVSEDEPVVPDWDKDTAVELADKEGIALTDEHWQVVGFLRKHFEEVGALEYARDVSVILDQHFKKQGGLKYLFTLFPKGPVSQGCKIAGIPIPGDSRDGSFGTSA